MFGTLSSQVPSDVDYPPRQHTLDVRSRVLAGTLYDVLTTSFQDERTPGGEYIPIRKRRPSVRYNLCRLVVQDSVALLFGEGRFPSVETPDKTTHETLIAVMDESRFNQVMLDAAIRGSVGSVVIHMRVLAGRVFFAALDTWFLTPEYDPTAPDTMLRVTERYKVRGDVLASRGYTISDDLKASWFWFQRVFGTEAETWFLPWPVSETEATPQIDTAHTTQHGLGFVPMVWIRNLPGGGDIDGACTFLQAIETSIEIDYQLSQAGRGLKYSSDPLLMIREPGAPDGDLVRSASSALIVSKDGDAKLLEISGTAAAAVIEYVRCLRELALESIHGNRSSADKISAAQSGRALELMHQPLIWVADQLRVSYGDNGILPLMRMVAMASGVHALTVKGKPIQALNQSDITLRWPAWFSPTEHDKSAVAGTLSALRSAGLMSRETGVKLADVITNDLDVVAEVKRILADEAAARANAAELPAAQSKLTENLPA